MIVYKSIFSVVKNDIIEFVIPSFSSITNFTFCSPDSDKKLNSTLKDKILFKVHYRVYLSMVFYGQPLSVFTSHSFLKGR